MALKSSAGNSSKLTRQQKAAQLDALELTASSSRNLLINSVKQMFEKGAIRTINIAENLIKLIQQNKMDEFDEKFAKIEKNGKHEGGETTSARSSEGSELHGGRKRASETHRES